MNRHFSKTDILALGALLALTLIVLFARHDFTRAPAEDAAILMRYSEHLAEGHGIVWNIGDPPVDGATDFLYMAFLALLHWLGISLEQATVATGVAAHFATVALVYIAPRKLYGANRWLAAFGAIWLALGPGLAYTEAYFGTAFFAFFVGLTWVFASWTALDDRPGIAWAFALSGLVSGLIRPEGVIAALLMLAGIVFMKGWRRARKTVLIFAGVFVVLGGLYFLWRWDYFGYPLPNPFYRKGGGRIYVEGLKTAIRAVLAFGLPFLPAYLLVWWPRPSLRQAVFALIPVAGFSAAWILLSNEMNYLYRFQYAVLPILLISWPPLMQQLTSNLGIMRVAEGDSKIRSLYAVSAALLVALLLQRHYVEYKGVAPRSDGRYDVAMILRDYKDKGYTVATSEAGLVPYYSRWKSVDTWGLNDSWITHNKGITPEYLDKYHPHVITFHAFFSPVNLPPREKAWYEMGGWDQMVAVMKDYAESNGYVLAAVFGRSPFNTNWYYVRSDFPDSAEIVQRIRTTPYAWVSDGQPSVDFAHLCEP